MLSAGGDEEKEAGAFELVSTRWGCPKANLAHHTMSILLGSRPPCVPPFACNGGDGSLWCHGRRPQLRLTFFPFLFSQLLHILGWRLEEHREPSTVRAGYCSWSNRGECSFLSGWRIGGTLAPILFASAATPMVQVASFLSKKRGNLELPKSSKANECEECSSQGALYRRRSLGKLTTHRVQGKNVKQNEFHSIPKGAFSLQIRVAS